MVSRAVSHAVDPCDRVGVERSATRRIEVVAVRNVMRLDYHAAPCGTGRFRTSS